MISGKLILKIFGALRLIEIREGLGEDGEYTECNNFTIINFVLKLVGPTHEARLTSYMLIIQVRIDQYPLVQLSILNISHHTLRPVNDARYSLGQVWVSY